MRRGLEGIVAYVYALKSSGDEAIAGKLQIVTIVIDNNYARSQGLGLRVSRR
jgi:hypothetical protein